MSSLFDKGSLYAVKGRIFDIQRYSLHDGMGIRTIVFLKGCVFRCRWCCNPESQEYAMQTMHMEGKAKTVGKDVTVEEVMRTVRCDIPYYRRSGGGMTLSGGEALCQPDFTEALLTVAQDESIHTAIETTGYAERSVLDRILPHLDQVLMDIKHVDSAKHREFTGRDNLKIMENARYIAERVESLIIRVPVIPSFNDTEKEIASIARFAATLPGVRHLHLLPYHRLGRDKYAGLSRPYLMGDIEPPSPEKMKYLCSVAQESGLFCQIGG